MLFCFAKAPLCFFCKLHNKTLINLFSSCNQVISLWIETKLFFFEYVQLILFSTQIVTLSSVKGNGMSFLIQNMILMVFKLYDSMFKNQGSAPH